MSMTHFEEYGVLPFCNQLNLKFRNFFYGTCPGHWKNRLPVNRIMFILEDDGTSCYEDEYEKFPLPGGTVVFVPAFHEIIHRQSERMLVLSIHFNMELFQGVDFFLNYGHCRHRQKLELIAQVRQMVKQPDRLVLISSFQSLCWQYFQEFFRDDPIPAEKLKVNYTPYEKLFCFLHENCHAGITVEDMARIMQMNKRDFSRKFIQDTGYPPKNLFNRLLASCAERMLISSDKTIKEIAYQLQFCNEFYFSRFFRQHFGVSPREYKLTSKKI